MQLVAEETLQYLYSPESELHSSTQLKTHKLYAC